MFLKKKLVPLWDCFAFLQALTSFRSETVPWGISVPFEVTDTQMAVTSNIMKDHDMGFLYVSNFRAELLLKTYPFWVGFASFCFHLASL